MGKEREKRLRERIKVRKQANDINSNILTLIITYSISKPSKVTGSHLPKFCMKFSECFSFSFSFLAVWEFELRALHLQSSHFTTWATPPVQITHCIYLAVTVVWTQGLTLAKQALYHLIHSTSPFSEFFRGQWEHRHSGVVDYILPFLRICK
jgi:hypothetical protein